MRITRLNVLSAATLPEHAREVWRRQVTTVDLGVARRAVRVKAWPELRYGVDVDAGATAVVAVAVPDMASQAEEGGRLLQQVVGDRAVRRMAVRAVLSHRRVLVGERALLLGMALPAQAG